MKKLINQSEKRRSCIFTFGLMFIVLVIGPGQMAIGLESPGGLDPDPGNIQERLGASNTNDELFRIGRPGVYRGEQLREIAFPLGGIGTGTISLGGRGNLRDWEIFNRPGKGINFPFTFFALYMESDDKKFSRVLEGQIMPPYSAGFGYRREEVPGLPRFRTALFR
ncbi:MAG: GH116 family glycosyl-hydrolase, partial [Methanosarcina sp.]|nr:GH116 family glycosyl-hydrolase [Methanosarcina sp.]